MSVESYESLVNELGPKVRDLTLHPVFILYESRWRELVRSDPATHFKDEQFWTRMSRTVQLASKLLQYPVVRIGLASANMPLMWFRLARGTVLFNCDGFYCIQSGQLVHLEPDTLEKLAV